MANLMTKTYYIFVEANLFLAQHNMRMGRYVSSAMSSIGIDANILQAYLNGSIDYRPFKYNPDNPITCISPFMVSATADYRIEHDAEVVRFKHFPLKPSRLSALYAFDCMETCEHVANKYKWDITTAKQVELIENPYTRIHKADMELVSLARGHYKATIPGEQDYLPHWSKYWQGEQNDNTEPIWEYLIEGAVQFIK